MLFIKILTAFKRRNVKEERLEIFVGPFESRQRRTAWKRNFRALSSRRTSRVHSASSVNSDRNLFPGESEPREVYDRIWNIILAYVSENKNGSDNR